jgi:integrase
LEVLVGLRKGEAMALQEEDINFELGIIDVNKTLLYHVENEKEDAFGPHKTKNSYRKVAIDRFLIQELKQYQLLKKKYKFMLGKEYSKFNFVFCKNNGDRLRARTIQTALDRLKKGRSS